MPGSSELRHGDQWSLDLRDLEGHAAVVALRRGEGHFLLPDVPDARAVGRPVAGAGPRHGARHHSRREKPHWCDGLLGARIDHCLNNVASDGADERAAVVARKLRCPRALVRLVVNEFILKYS